MLLEIYCGSVFMLIKKQSKVESVQEVMRSLPSMEKILTDGRLGEFDGIIDRDSLKRMCRDALERWRDMILDREVLSFDGDVFFAELRQELKRRLRPSLRPVLNCTGVVVHTNLGRSCLSAEAAEAARAAACGYSTLEYNLESGARGHRNFHVEWLLCQLTGAEAALVVNNNAGAVLLVLAALAGKKEAVVSRGELVEIGCTNRTHLKDYENAITDETAMLLKVHPSNFRITGYVSLPLREDLAELAHAKGLLMMEDLGSGILVDAQTLGLEGEPTVNECLEAGVDVVTFSGDKLLGGPQIGAIVGKKEIVDRIRKYPLLRALRCDKMTLAAMEATLRLYLRGDWKKIPSLGMIAVPADELKARAARLKKRIDAELADFCLQTKVVPVEDAVGGGAYPERPLPGWAVSLLPANENLNAGILQERLRRCTLPVVAGARSNELLLHMRTLPAENESVLMDSLREALVTER